MRRVSWALFFCVLTGCSSYRVKVNGRPRDRIYPDGIYKHNVKLTLPEGNRQRFEGVVSIGEKEIVVVGLSVFQTTAFRLKDNLSTGDLKVEIFAMPLKQYEAKLREFYLLLRKVFLLPLKDDGGATIQRENRPDGFPSSVQTKDLKQNAKLIFEEYDVRQIPLRVKIEGANFSVDIKVTGYEI
jgi:hypothetical protein